MSLAVLAAAMYAPAMSAAAQDYVSSGMGQQVFFSPSGQPFRAPQGKPYPVMDWFNAADANHDGMITRNELIAWRNAEFDRFDRNHDGYIDISDAPRFAAQARARLDEARTAFDLNHDGRISRAEFASGPTPMFDMADLDHNNVLDAYELKQLKKG